MILVPLGGHILLKVDSQHPFEILLGGTTDGEAVNEIIPAAEAAEQGASVQEISDMAADGLFGGGPMPTLKM